MFARKEFTAQFVAVDGVQLAPSVFEATSARKVALAMLQILSTVSEGAKRNVGAIIVTDSKGAQSVWSVKVTD